MAAMTNRRRVSIFSGIPEADLHSEGGENDTIFWNGEGVAWEVYRGRVSVVAWAPEYVEDFDLGYR